MNPFEKKEEEESYSHYFLLLLRLLMAVQKFHKLFWVVLGFCYTST